MYNILFYYFVYFLFHGVLWQRSSLFYDAPVRLSRVAAIAVVCSALLTGCGRKDTAVVCRTSYWDGVVGTCLPAGWKPLEPTVLQGGDVPGEVIAAFQADQFVSGQIPTVVVTREALLRDWDSAAYSDANVQSVKTLPAFSSLDEREVTIDDAKVTLHTFTAQPLAEEPAKRFYQLSAVARKVGYTFTAALPVSVEKTVEQQVLAILRGATFRVEE